MADELRSANVAVIVDALPDDYLKLRAANVAVICEINVSNTGRVQGPAAQSM